MEEIRKYFNRKKEVSKVDNAITLKLPASKWLEQVCTVYNQAITTLVQDETFIKQKVALGPSLIEIVLPYIKIDTYESLKDDIEVKDSDESDLDEILQTYYACVKSQAAHMMVIIAQSPECITALYIRALLDFLNEDSDEVVHKANVVAVIAVYEAFYQEIEDYLKKKGYRHLSIQVNKKQIHLFPMRRTVEEYSLQCIQILGHIDRGVLYKPCRTFEVMWEDTLKRHEMIPDRIEDVQFQIDMKQCKEVENKLDMEITKTQFLNSFEYYMIDAVHPVFEWTRSDDMFGIYLKDKDYKVPIEQLLIGVFDYICKEPIKFLFIALTVYESFKESPEDKTLQKLATSTYYLVERYRTVFQEVIESKIGGKRCSFFITSYESTNEEYQGLVLTNTRNVKRYNKWAKR